MAEDLSDKRLRSFAGHIARGNVGLLLSIFEVLKSVRDKARAENRIDLNLQVDATSAKRTVDAEELAKLRARVATLEGNLASVCAIRVHMQTRLDQLEAEQREDREALRDITAKHVALELEASQLRRDKERFEFRALVIAAQERVLEKLCRRISNLRAVHEHIAGMNTDAGVIAAESLRVDEMVAKATRPEDQYLILDMKYSRDWLIWWQPNSCGYTFFLASAGRYTLEKARSIVGGSNRELRIVPVASAYEQSRLVVYSDQRYQLREEAPRAD